MSISKDSQAHIVAIAVESLDTFKKVADSAESHIANTTSTSIFAASSPDAALAAAHNQARIRRSASEAHKILRREPAIARVVVTDPDHIHTTYYICRPAPVSIDDSKVKLASYRSPVGRLAALQVGEDHALDLPNQTKTVTVLENARFRPIRSEGEWDSQNSVLEGDAYGPWTIESLLKLKQDHYRTDEEIDEEIVERLLKEERERENVREGIRRNVITKMDLRDQPILDRNQDDIFRLPLNSRLLILGAPGTGKTTTLIRRLGQKLDSNYLNEDEQRIVQLASHEEEGDPSRNWIMFTPTELLRLYVKEAFNRESIPAPDTHISTWTDFRDDLARNQFGILRSSSRQSSLVMKSDISTLKLTTENNQIEWFSDFDQFQQIMFWNEMRTSASNLSISLNPDVAELGRKIIVILNAADKIPGPGVFTSLMRIAKETRDLARALKESTDRKIRSALNLQVNRDNGFLDAIASFLERNSNMNRETDDQEIDEDEEETGQHQIGRAAAVTHYMRAVRAKASAHARSRNVNQSSLTGRLIEWIGDRALVDSDLQEVGESLIVQTALRWFANPVRRYIDGVTRRYRGFRRSRQTAGHWYRSDGFSPTDIHPLEVDVLLLVMMRCTDDLITGAPGLFGIENPASNLLKRMQNLYRTQVLVDEATDFSPIQLACMAAMARPGTRSFFACGDFNQRVTNWGTRSIEEIRWAIPNIETKAISIAYRQSRQLHELARQIVNLSGVDTGDIVLPMFTENDGVPPVLATNLTDAPAIADWLAHRIVEIEKFVHELPSVAVLVNNEETVHEIATALDRSLTDENIRVIPCTDGRVQGRDGAVRVFNVKHIKGLEFEAVFFVGIDWLAEHKPDLFDKYLYVGATRAATYLGITCERDLPPRMATMEKLFEDGWQ